MSGAGVGCVAESGAGDGTNTALAGCGGGIRRAGCVALSGTGDSANTGYNYRGRAGSTGVDVGCIAVSGTGRREDYSHWCGVGPSWGGIGVAVGCVAVGGGELLP